MVRSETRRAEPEFVGYDQPPAIQKKENDRCGEELTMTGDMFDPDVMEGGFEDVLGNASR
jgi:hypothetical protein